MTRSDRLCCSSTGRGGWRSGKVQAGTTLGSEGKENGRPVCRPLSPRPHEITTTATAARFKHSHCAHRANLNLNTFRSHAATPHNTADLSLFYFPSSLLRSRESSPVFQAKSSKIIFSFVYISTLTGKFRRNKTIDRHRAIHAIAIINLLRRDGNLLITTSYIRFFVSTSCLYYQHAR